MVTPPPNDTVIPPRPSGLRGFLRGPRFVDRRGLVFVLGVFAIVGLAFGMTFYAFDLTRPGLPSAPVAFTNATMVSWNATFQVSSVTGGPYPAANFTVQFTFNQFLSSVVPLAHSGVNATVTIRPQSNVYVSYEIRWIDANRDGAVSAGDVFWVTGVGAGLTPLSYCDFALIYDGGAWTAHEYWTTSSSIV